MSRPLEDLKQAIFYTVMRMLSICLVTVVLLVVLPCYIMSGMLARGADGVTDKMSSEKDWLMKNNLLDMKHAFPDTTFEEFIQFHLSSHSWHKLDGLSDRDKDRITLASKLAAEKLALELWMKQNDIKADYSILQQLGLGSLQSLSQADHDQVQALVASFHYSLARTNYQLWTWVVRQLNKDLRHDPQLERRYINQYLSQSKRSTILEGTSLLYRLGVTVAVILGVLCITSLLSNGGSTSGKTIAGHQVSVASYLSGTYLAPQKCRVSWWWEEPCSVGRTVSFDVHFIMYNGKPYPISDLDNVIIDICLGENKINTTEEFGLTEDANVVKVSFSVIQSGDYWIKVRVGGWDIHGSPFVKKFDPGPPVPSKTQFAPYNSTIVLTSGVPYILYVEPRDEFNNVCRYKHVIQVTDDYTLEAVEVSSGSQVIPSMSFSYKQASGLIEMSVIVYQPGCYQTKTLYKGEKIHNGECNAIVLSDADALSIQRHVLKESHNIYYKSQLLSSVTVPTVKSRKVYCYISPRQLTIKEFYLRIFPKRLHTFRVCPSTKFEFKRMDNSLTSSTPDDELRGFSSQPKQRVIIDDGTQPPVMLESKYAHMIAATFTSFLLKNIGGSETFKDKREFFYCELRKMQHKHAHSTKAVQVQRYRLLESSFKATESFTLSDWLKRFEIQFTGEEGLDWGGLRREWFELICGALFDPSQSGLFRQFKDDSQGLCLPNAGRPESLKLKLYEFAGKIVGKCLYESALGGTYYQAVKAKFARSFLAQLIGLRVNYRYFEQDDPDLYVSKVKYFEENDPEEMEVFFVEEEYSSTGQLLKTVELCPGGATIQVTKENKLKYLNVLAQYRLVDSVREEVDRFLKGLNEIVPDNLLSIFDENELELLMSGTGEYKVSDLKAHHSTSGSGPRFTKTLTWFWTVVGSFNQEQMARLLQFTTGSSQLPPEGFSALSPIFQISPLPTHRGLPMAHTCFNQLCLPDYDTIEDFHQSLLLAINEGSQGFGFA